MATRRSPRRSPAAADPPPSSSAADPPPSSSADFPTELMVEGDDGAAAAPLPPTARPRFKLARRLSAPDAAALAAALAAKRAGRDLADALTRNEMVAVRDVARASSSRLLASTQGDAVDFDGDAEAAELGAELERRGLV